MSPSSILCKIFRCLPIKEKKILFMSYYGEKYGCNPLYISEYLAENRKDWDIIWAFTKPEDHQNIKARTVRYRSLLYFYELSTCQVILTNYRMTADFRKRKGQLYIQTWHSSLRLKMIEKDAVSTLPANYIEMAKKDSQQIDALLSGCEKSTEIFRRSFWYEGPIIPTGTPRMDMLIQQNENLRNQCKKKLGIDTKEKVLVYAPTFRKDNTLKYYDIDFIQLRDSLERKWSGNWKIILRLHPHLVNLSKQISEGKPYILDATDYDNIQELLLIADVVISDYSSLIFDFAFTRKPCILYVPDLEDYTRNDRGLYFDINALPFPKTMNNVELTKCIDSFDFSIYHHDLEAFMTKIGSYEDGHACERVVNYIEDTVG